MVSLNKMSLRNQLLLLIISISFSIFLLSFGYLTLTMRSKAYADATEMARMQAREYANLVSQEINNDFSLTQGLGMAFKNFNVFPSDSTEEIISPILYEYLSTNPEFHSTWVSLELNALLPEYDLPYGRVRYTWVRQDGRIIFQRDTLNLEGDDPGSLYEQIKLSMKQTITNPYWYSYTGGDDDRVLEVSPCIPLIQDGGFAGLAGADIILDRFQELIDSIKPFGVGYAYLLSNDGTFVGHPNNTLLGNKIGDVNPEYYEQFEIGAFVSNGTFEEHYSYSDLLQKEAFHAYAPVQIGDTGTPWSLAIVVPRAFIMAEANRMLFYSIVVAVLGLVILAWVIYLVAARIANPLARTTDLLNTLSVGDLKSAKTLQVKGEDEIAQMADSLNKLVTGLKDTANFAQRIGEGELEVSYEKLGERDSLGSALLNMRDSLAKARKEEQIRKKEDEKRNWTTQGQAKFADILRFNNDNLEELTFNIIKNLVKYLNANQGGVFLINDENKDDKFLELTACYAYDRKKYLTRRIDIGEGLVGACYLEKKHILLTDIPKDYIQITSGLGDENPCCLLIMPLLLNEEVYGVIEMASFHPFESHQIEFVQKVAENIASTISSVKINLRTAYLLEQSQQQAEEMRAQEEEMRQNMEEMHATQEEMMRKDKEIQGLADTTEKLFCVMEYDAEGIIRKTNPNFDKVSGYTAEEIEGKHHSIFFDNKDWKNSENYRLFWDMLRRGKPVTGTLKRIRKDGSTFIVKGVSKAVMDDYDNLQKVVEITIDISQEMASHQ